MRFEDINPVSSADWLMTTQGLQVYWAKFSGFKENFTRPTFADGLSARKRKAQTGSSEIEDATLEVPFDPEKAEHIALLQWIEEHKDGTPFDHTLRPVVRNNEITYRGSKSLRLSTCRLMSYSLPGEIDVNGGDQVGMISITFSIESGSFAGS